MLDDVNVIEAVNVSVVRTHSAMTVHLDIFNPQNVSLWYESVVITVLFADKSKALVSNSGSVSP